MAVTRIFPIPFPLFVRCCCEMETAFCFTSEIFLSCLPPRTRSPFLPFYALFFVVSSSSRHALWLALWLILHLLFLCSLLHMCCCFLVLRTEQVQKQVHPNLNVSDSAVAMLDSKLYVLFAHLCEPPPMTTSDCEISVKRLFPSDLAEW